MPHVLLGERVLTSERGVLHRTLLLLVGPLVSLLCISFVYSICKAAVRLCLFVLLTPHVAARLREGSKATMLQGLKPLLCAEAWLGRVA